MDMDKQNWEMFEQNIRGKKVFLFGAGMNANIYFEKYGSNMILDGVIDNDSRKQGFCIDEFIPEALKSEKGKIKVSDPSVLSRYGGDEAVVLIASSKHYREIGRQLEEMGISNYFAIFLMEPDGKANAVTDEQRKIFGEEICRKEPIKQNKIFFRAFSNYGDHGKYITEALLRIRDDFDIVWAVNDMTTEVPAGVRKTFSGNWKRYLYEMETAKMWVLDLAVPSYVVKREGQIYIQTKHWASVTLKRFYLDTEAFKNVPELAEKWRRDGKLIDHIITGSDFDTQSCRRGFGFRGEVLQYGSPRSDALFHEKENREKVYAFYHIDMKSHTLLYAPTYRFDKKKGKMFHQAKELELDFERVKRALEEKFGGKWYLFLRLHPSVAHAFKNMEKPAFVIDVSGYNDSEELVSAADITISDFSSIMFEPAFVKKPVFLFSTDIADYTANEYDLLIDYYHLPFPIAESNEELEWNIKNFDSEKYVEGVSQFLDKYGVHEDGHASDRVAEFISETIKGRKECETKGE